MFDDPFFNRGYAPQTQLMKTDIREKDGQYLLEIEVPGFTKEDVKAELKDGYLTITADRKEPVENADERTKYVRKKILRNHEEDLLFRRRDYRERNPCGIQGWYSSDND